jgi:hypothetical protein
MPRLFFIVNQDLLDGSAHALYCFRHCWWLAKADSTQAVELIYPGSRSAGEILAHFGFEALPNFALRPLPAVRKAKGKRGATINLIYYWALYAYLQQRVQEGDWLISASFAKLFRFLLNRSGVRGRARLIY